MTRHTLLIIPALLAGLAGCATVDPNVVSYHEAQRMSTVQDAVVLAVRPVTVEGSQSGAGAMAGAVIGGTAGSSVGGYRDGFVGSVIGAVAGAVVGNAVERSATRQNAVELTLQFKNGDRRMVVQGNGPETFQPGDAVVVISNGYRVRVNHAPRATPNPPIMTPAPAPAPAPASPPAPIYTPR